MIVLTLPSKSFAALDYGKQSLVGGDFSGSDRLNADAEKNLVRHPVLDIYQSLCLP